MDMEVDSVNASLNRLPDAVSSILPPLLAIEPSKRITFAPIPWECADHRLQLQNIWSSPVYFKIKTTSPYQYAVKPSSGIIEPHQKLFIRITLHPQCPEAFDQFPLHKDEEGNVWAMPHDKFQILSYELLDPKLPVKNVQGSGNMPPNVDASTVRSARLNVAFSTQNILENKYRSQEKATDMEKGKFETKKQGIPNNATADKREQQEITSGTSAPRGLANSGPTHSVNGKPSIAQSANARSTTGFKAPITVHLADLERKYSELMEYCIALEKQKNVMEVEREAMEAELNKLRKDNASSVKSFLPYLIAIFAMLIVFYHWFGF